MDRLPIYYFYAKSLRGLVSVQKILLPQKEINEIKQLLSLLRLRLLVSEFWI